MNEYCYLNCLYNNQPGKKKKKIKKIWRLYEFPVTFRPLKNSTSLSQIWPKLSLGWTEWLPDLLNVLKKYRNYCININSLLNEQLYERHIVFGRMQGIKLLKKKSFCFLRLDFNLKTNIQTPQYCSTILFSIKKRRKSELFSNQKFIFYFFFFYFFFEVQIDPLLDKKRSNWEILFRTSNMQCWFLKLCCEH